MNLYRERFDAGPWSKLAALVAAGLGLLSGGEVNESEMILELPRFEITEKLELPPRESWRYAQWGDFELLSNADDATTQEFVREYLRWMEALRAVYSLVGWKPTGPISLIVCRNQDFFDAFGWDGFSAGMHRNSQRIGAGEDQTHSIYVLDTSISPFRLSGRERFGGEEYNASRASNMVLVDTWRSDPQPPYWFVVASTSLVNDLIMDRGTLVLGTPKAYFDMRPALVHVPPISVAALFDGEMPGRRGYRVNFRNIAESKHDLSLYHTTRHLFRRCMLSGEDRYREGYLKLVAKARVGPVTEEVFEECFGKNYQEMDKELRTIRDGMKWGVLKINDFKFEVPEITLREATEAEVGRIKGEALALMDDPEVSAYAMLVAPYVRKASDPRLLAALGLYHRANGNDKRAREFLEAAAAAGVDRSLAYLELGNLRYEEAKQNPQGGDGKLSAEQAAHVLEPLLKARALKWASPKVYDQLAEVWTRSEVPPTRENLAVLVEGIQASPLRAELVCRTVAFCVQAGFAAEGRAWADYGLKTFPDPAVRSRLEQATAMIAETDSSP